MTVDLSHSVCSEKNTLGTIAFFSTKRRTIACTCLFKETDVVAGSLCNESHQQITMTTSESGLSDKE